LITLLKLFKIIKSLSNKILPRDEIYIAVPPILQASKPVAHLTVNASNTRLPTIISEIQLQDDIPFTAI